MCWKIFDSPSCSGPRNTKWWVGSAQVQSERFGLPDWQESNLPVREGDSPTLSAQAPWLDATAVFQTPSVATETGHASRTKGCVGLEVVRCYPLTPSAG